MTSAQTNTDTCGTVRASLLYHAPIFSESGACVLAKGHAGDHRDVRGRTWYVIPLHPAPNNERETAK
ncbi:hypothetical protein ACKI14_42405 [Streptomyces turgidiscabies]|uniref:Uncharacterized protein n=1 Tax=Streptomyces turgidiscabies (strain Car8) TaxID=698760 RepID=L7FBP5_STRT8|nr:hypothetical protein [Streptomyces turgidiscabies]ELP68672.1 hypothetical protein STRTUCAR8_03859 [Streptomyces turgidiscabies Car8]GAQ68810.1 hypothetical protein T45_00525 [Streptomyces turgidiscabies]